MELNIQGGKEFLRFALVGIHGRFILSACPSNFKFGARFYGARRK